MDAVQEVEGKGQDDRGQQDGRHGPGAGLGQLDDDIGDDVGGLVAAVGRIAQVAIDLAQLEHLDHVLRCLRLR